ncbi:MAG: indole-3-glycerol phosphate synthase [Candidatus Omnitrophica bacterium CG11_big_fil_rev_8_21_14_0_20_64_10]|nr:MAG: indole-3-glycerol phosphate synthase [Candidatus Omnitrophica bacterium CG11_big_fil_rev_8_21_14_0_20_64_10]
MEKLKEILAHKREEVARNKQVRPLSGLERRLKDRPPVRPFRETLAKSGRLSLIAEVKRASPSAGVIRAGADAVETARLYARAGAQAISVLTDEKFFAGRLEDLTRVKEGVPVPVLRKDFLIDEYQVVEAAAAGADAVLLIVAALEQKPLERLLKLTGDLGLDTLVEAHDERELKRALDLPAQLIGINNRNLETLKVALNTTRELCQLIPADRTVVSESGLGCRADVEAVEKLGVDAVLIGEALMGSDDPAVRIKTLMGW